MKKKEYAGKIRVDPEIEALITPPDDDQALEESLLKEGRAISPLWLWGDLLVDGHRRHKLCKKHKLPFDVKQVYEDATDIEDVKDRMLRDTLAHRHSSQGERARYIAARVDYQVSKGSKLSEAVRAVAEESNVSTRSVRRAIEHVEAVESLAEEAKPVAEAMSARAVKKLASLPKPKQRAVVKKADGDGKAVGKEIRKASSKEKASAASLFVAMQKQHFSGKAGLPQTIDAMADANGGRGLQYGLANTAIDTFLRATAAMRDGKK